MARPTTYKPEVQKKVIDLMKQGASIEEVCLELDICRQTFYNWCEKYPALLDTKKRGEGYSHGWWMREGRRNLKDKEFSYTGWYMNMKNRFGWTDKQQTDHTTGGDKIILTISKEDAKL